MIDINKGFVCLTDKNLIIKKGLTQGEFLCSELSKDINNNRVHLYSIYYMNPQKMESDIFIMVLYFNQNEIIEFLTLSLFNNEDLPCWENWSEYKAFKKKEDHDKWLETNIGKPPYKYFWGEISSEYDPRSGSSMIAIRYS